jgi:hypothetical protein
MCVDRGANMNEIRWTDKVYLDSQGNIRSSDGCSTEHYQNDFVSGQTEVVKVGEPLPNSDEINKAMERGKLYKRGYKDALDKAFSKFDANCTYGGDRVLQILEKLKEEVE